MNFIFNDADLIVKVILSNSYLLNFHFNVYLVIGGIVLKYCFRYWDAISYQTILMDKLLSIFDLSDMSTKRTQANF